MCTQTKQTVHGDACYLNSESEVQFTATIGMLFRTDIIVNMNVLEGLFLQGNVESAIMITP